jgi:hypothetical protein
LKFCYQDVLKIGKIVFIIILKTLRSKINDDYYKNLIAELSHSATKPLSKIMHAVRKENLSHHYDKFD